MVIYDFSCPGGHTFEGWFGSRAEYERQRDEALIACPVCGTTDLTRELCAPAVHLRSDDGLRSDELRSDRGLRSDGGLRSRRARPRGDGDRAELADAFAEEPMTDVEGGVEPGESPRRVVRPLRAGAGGATPLRALVDAVRNVIESECDDVGPRFSAEATAIHFGDRPARPIVGTSTDDEEREMRELGVPFAKVALPRFDD